MKYFFIFLLVVLFGCSPDPEKELQEKISDWIRINAIYPNSYKPMSFAEYELITPVKGSPYYGIYHEYLLKDKERRTDYVKHFFIADSNFKITYVSSKRTGFRQSILPSVFEWTAEYGNGFKDVNYGGADIELFLQMYKDYQLLGGLHDYFDYVDKGCLEVVRGLVKDSIDKQFELRRIIRVVDDNYLNDVEVITPQVVKGFDKKYCRFACVLKYNYQEGEFPFFMDFDRVTKTVKLIAPARSMIFSIPVDSTFLQSDCAGKLQLMR